MVVVTPEMETEVTSDEAEVVAREVVEAPSEANGRSSKTESAPPVTGMMSRRVTSRGAGMVPSDIENTSAETEASAENEATSAENEATSVEGELTSVEDEVTSAEGEAASADDEATSVEDEAEDEATSADDEATSVEDEVTSAEDEVTSAEDEATSAEDEATPAEDEYTSEEDEATSAEDEYASTEDDVISLAQEESMPSQTKVKGKTKLSSEGATIRETEVRTTRARVTSTEKSVILTDPNEESADRSLASMAPLDQEVWSPETRPTLPGVLGAMGAPRQEVEELRSVFDAGGSIPDWKTYYQSESFWPEENHPHDLSGKSNG